MIALAAVVVMLAGAVGGALGVGACLVEAWMSSGESRSRRSDDDAGRTE